MQASGSWRVQGTGERAKRGRHGVWWGEGNTGSAAHTTSLLSPRGRESVYQLLPRIYLAQGRYSVGTGWIMWLNSPLLPKDRSPPEQGSHGAHALGRSFPGAVVWPGGPPALQFLLRVASTHSLVSLGACSLIFLSMTLHANSPSILADATSPLQDPAAPLAAPN